MGLPRQLSASSLRFDKMLQKMHSQGNMIPINSFYIVSWLIHRVELLELFRILRTNLQDLIKPNRTISIKTGYNNKENI